MDSHQPIRVICNNMPLSPFIVRKAITALIRKYADSRTVHLSRLGSLCTVVMSEWQRLAWGDIAQIVDAEDKGWVKSNRDAMVGFPISVNETCPLDTITFELDGTPLMIISGLKHP